MRFPVTATASPALPTTMKTNIQIPWLLKSSLILTGAWLAAGSVNGQTSLAADEARHYASLTRQNPQQLEKLPLQVQADLARPIGLREGEYGGLLIPDKRLSLEALHAAKTAPLPVAELWFHSLAPMKDGWVVPQAELCLVEVTDRQEPIQVPCCPLGVHRNSQGALELLLYGKDKTPLLTLPLRTIDSPATSPIEFLAAREGDEAGRITIRLFGKYEAQFLVTELIPW